MNRNLTLLTLAFWFSTFSFGQTYTGENANNIIPGSNKVRVNKTNGNIEYFEFSETSLKSQTPNAAFLKSKTGIPEIYKFKASSTFKDQKQNTHEKFQLYYGHVKVEGLEYTIHYKNGSAESANGQIIKNTGFQAKASINESQAIQNAINSISAKKYRWDNNKNLYPSAELLFVPQDTSLILCYKIDIYALQPLSRNYVYVNAHNGNILKTINRLHDANAVGTARTKYSGDVQITTNHVDSQYFLNETSRGNGINTYNMNNGINYDDATVFSDDDNHWDSDIDQVAYDAHFGSEMTYDYFLSKFGRNSIDGNGFALNSYVHFYTNYANAFWDGERMTYGDGDGATTLPLICMDIVAHEITHGLTSFTANLEYRNESGALNESFSDIFGIAVDFYANPSTANYIMGEQVLTNGDIIRSMEDPNSIGDPDTYMGNYWHSSTSDNGGVHTNSSVQNYWYYLLCEGGSGVNDNGDLYQVTPIGMDAASAIAYRTLTVYLSQYSQYNDARFYAIQSAIDLYGECSQEVEAVTNAWYAVGVGEAYNQNVSSLFKADNTYACSAPATINFTNSSVNANSYQWYIDDSEVSTEENPAIIFDQPGNYSISLIATGHAVCNSEPDTITLEDYITVSDIGSPASPVTIPTSVHGGSGGIYSVHFAGINQQSAGADDGYVDYSCNSKAQVVEGKKYAIDILTSSFNEEAVAAWIDLNNDGEFNRSELVYTSSAHQVHQGEITIPKASYYNSPLRLRIGSDVSSNRATLESMNSSYYGQYEDYSIFIEENTEAPEAYFTVSDSIIGINQTISFTNESLNIPTNFAWSFNGGTPNTSNFENPAISYSSTGRFEATLTATNDNGSSQYSRYIVVSNDYTMGTDTISSALQGRIYDSGGKDGNYSDGEYNSFLISSDCSKEVILTMEEFSSESCCDRLIIYNGQTSSDPILKTFKGTISTPEDIVASSGSMLLVFSSDGSVTEAGFEAVWTSSTLGDGNEVIADFIAPSEPVPFNHEFQLTDNSSNDPINWFWNFGDGSISNQQNPIHKYLSSGTKEIELIVDNCIDKDTTSQQIAIENEPSIQINSDTITYDVISGDLVSNYLPVNNTNGGTLVFTSSVLRTYQVDQQSVSNTLVRKIKGFNSVSKSGDIIYANIPTYSNNDEPVKTGLQNMPYQVNSMFNNLSFGIIANPGFYNNLSNTIISTGGKVSFINLNEFTNTMLDTLDVLVLDDYASFSDDGINNLRNWVQTGGTLMVTGDDLVNTFNKIVEGTGIEFVKQRLMSGYTKVQQHPVTKNISQYELSSSAQSKLNISPSATPIILDTNDLGHCAVAELGMGKLLAASDEVFGDYDLQREGHTELFFNMINWSKQQNASWLTVKGTERYVNATFSDSLKYVINSTGLIEGTHIGDIQLTSNDLDPSNIIIPIKLKVTGIENIDASTEEVWFPKVFTNHIDSTTFRIINDGTADLEIQSISSSIPEFQPVFNSLSIKPGMSETVKVYFAPTTQQIYASQLEILSSDPDQPSFILAINGNAVLPPILEVPDEIVQNLMTDEVSTFTLPLSNVNGGSSLAIDSILIENYSAVRGVFSDTIQNDLSGHKISALHLNSQYFDDLIIKYGGYTSNFLDTINTGDVIWINNNSNYLSDEEFDYIERWVSKGGGLFINTRNVNTNDKISTFLNKLDIGLTPNVTYSSIRSIADHPVTHRLNADDLIHSHSYYLKSETATPLIQDSDNNVFAMAQEHGYGRVVVTNFDSFEFYNTNSIKLFGINSMRWLANKNSWLWASNYPTDSINAGSHHDLNLIFDASNRFSGSYEAAIRFSSNDPNNDTISIKAVLNVTGVAKQAFTNDSIDFGEVFTGQIKTDSVKLYNPGTTELLINSIGCSNNTYSFNSNNLSIAPRTSQWFIVNYSPTNVGNDDSYIVFENNTTETYDTLFVHGYSNEAPVAIINPDNISAKLRTDEIESKSFIIDNTQGGSQLKYTIQIQHDGVTSSLITDDLQNVLDSLNTNIEQVLSVIPNKFNFSEGENSNRIGDGGSDMYDDGNYINTNDTSSISYSNDVITSSNDFGLNSRYFTKKYEGLFVLAADLNNIQQFSISGDLGADGSGSVDTALITTKVNGQTYHGYVKRVFNTGDPSVNHLIIVKANDDIEHLYDTNTNNDYHSISNLQSTSRLYYLLYGGSNSSYINNEETTAIMEAFLSVTSNESWIECDNVEGTVEAGTSENVGFNINTSGMQEGDYQAAIKLVTNDPNNSVDSVLVNLTVQNNFAPELINPIGNKLIHLTYNDAIDLTTVFNDSDNDPMFFTLSSSNNNIVFPALNNGTQLNLHPISTGVATITIVVTDNNWEPISYTFDVLVQGNNPPTLTSEIEDITLNFDHPYHTFELDDYFADPDGDQLSYSISSSNNDVVNCELSGNILVVNNRQDGIVVITVTANDGKGGKVADSFITTATGFGMDLEDIAENDEISIYPNPVNQILNIKLAHPSEVKSIEIVSLSGKTMLKLMEQFNSNTSINVDEFAQGLYFIIVTTENNKLQSKFIKK